MGCGAVQNPQTSQPYLKHVSSPSQVKSPSNQSTQLQQHKHNKNFIKNPNSRNPKPLPSNHQTLNHNYQIKQLLGKGTYGQVYRCINRSTQQQYALKIVKLNAKNKQQAIRHINNLKGQISLLKKLNHPNIVKYYSFDVSQNNQTVEIVFQLIEEGSLKDYVGKNGKLTEREASMICKQILEGLVYLHEKSIIHRDLKCANILLTKNKIVKITDFGTAKEMKVKTNQDIAKLCASLKGTPYYMAPQILKRSGHHKSADIWSFGCTLIEMLTGKAPWTTLTQNFEEIISYIISGVPPPLPQNISKQCQYFLQSCLDAVPSQRLTAQQLLNHRFIIMNTNRTVSPSLAYQKYQKISQKQQQTLPIKKFNTPLTPSNNIQQKPRTKKSSMYLDSPKFNKKSQPFLNYYDKQSNNPYHIKPQQIIIQSKQYSNQTILLLNNQHNNKNLPKSSKIKSAKRESNDLRKVSKTDGHMKMTEQNLMNWSEIQNQMIEERKSRRETKQRINANDINTSRTSQKVSSHNANNRPIHKNPTTTNSDNLIKSNYQKTTKLKTQTSSFILQQQQLQYQQQTRYDQVINTALAKQQRNRYVQEQKRKVERKQQERRKWEEELKKERMGKGNNNG